MAIFDSNKVRYLTYYIVLDDPNQVADYQAQYPNGVNRAITPGAADVEFAAPFRGYTDPAIGVPYIWTPNYSTSPSDPPFPLNVARFSRHTGGFLGIGGTTVTFYWIGQFVYSGPPTVNGAPVPPATRGFIGTRNFIEGFETPAGGFYTSGMTGGIGYSRDAARHTGGIGLALRGPTAIGPQVPINTLDAAYQSHEAWERIYVRLRALPTTGTVEFMGWGGTPSALAGIRLGITPTGAIAVFNVTAGGVRTLMGTFGQLPVWSGVATDLAWQRLDFLIHYNNLTNPNGAGTFNIYQRGVSIASVGCSIAAGGLGANDQRIQLTQIGNGLGGANDLQLDIDDWHSAPFPTDGVSAPVFTGDDWLLGSSIRRIKAKAYNGAMSGWTGDFRVALQHATDGNSQTNSATLTSSISGATLAIDTDSDLIIDACREAFDPPNGFAPVTCMVVNLVSGRGAASGSLGYKLGTAAAVDVAITQVVGKGTNLVRYSVPGTSADFPADITPIVLRHVKGVGADAATVAQLDAWCEICGTFGPEDVRVTEVGGDPASVPEFPRFVGQHNAPYPNSEWATGSQVVPPAGAPYIVKTGTYVGNGTGQDITFRAPVALFFCRPVAGVGNTGGGQWWSTTLIGKSGWQQGQSAHICAAEEDLGFVPGTGPDTQMKRYYIRLSGASSQINQNAITYQYIAVMDPAMRFIMNGVFCGKQSEASRVQPLINPDFFPEFGLFMRGTLDNTTAIAMYCKSTGLSATRVTNIGGATNASAISWTTGALTWLAGFINSNYPDVSWLLFRKHDGNNDTGEAGVFSIGSYTGDGSASRTLSIGTAGKRPVWALIVGDGSAGAIRDPSHTTNTSETPGGSSVTTSITGGGIDQVSVGTTLNTNNVIFSYLVFWGSTTAGNGGWSIDGEFIPVEADMPADGPWPPAPDPTVYDTPPTPPVVIVGEPDLDTTTAVLTTGDDIGGLQGGLPCETYTRSLVNIALSHLEVSKVVGNLATEQSEAASLARRHCKEDINTVLRDFPWDFATRYANLVLVTGSEASPANNDWIYAYRAPQAMMLARRIAKKEKGRTYDPDPIKFRLGQDTGGQLVFCNALASATIPLVLEYTHRNECPAFWGDAIFREALTWKFASSLSPLARDGKKKEFCLQMYALMLERARTVDAKEQQQEPNGDADWIAGRN